MENIGQCITTNLSSDWVPYSNFLILRVPRLNMVFKVIVRANDNTIEETYNGSIFHKEKEQTLEISTKSKDLKK